ncbi:response regulator transcription factor [Paenibacillus gorillae]|uniref:response regulator transcription factor n=1 Tax=Paenibacillus gorillae TaxID=1243662 RepID=UPI0004B79A46|nr:response regulator [Paenibacillus gorillae]
MFKVLLVDDEVYVRQGLRQLIDWQECGYEVIGEAANGAEAFEAVKASEPDLVVTDIRMPVVTGLELIGKVKEAGMEGIAFIVLSGYEDFKYAQQAMRYQVQDYILKPIDVDELKAALSRLHGQLQANSTSGGLSPEADLPLVLAVTDRMEENDPEAVRRAVRQFIQELERRGADAAAAGRTVGRLIANVKKIISDMEGSLALQGLDELIGWSVAGKGGFETLEERLMGFALEGTARIGELRKAKLQGSIHQVKSYIESNFRENMSLKGMASQHYMNPVYMGQLFRKTYGMYFNEFLLGVRIREAKKLLRQTELKIYEVAERAGFSSSNYFITQFEKLERTTPAEYRSRLLAQTGGGAPDE